MFTRFRTCKTKQCFALGELMIKYTKTKLILLTYSPFQA